MSKTQRIGLALFFLAALGIATGTGAHWKSQTVMLLFGYILFVFDDFGRFLLLNALRALWGAGWLYRRARGLPEPRKSMS